VTSGIATNVAYFFFAIYRLRSRSSKRAGLFSVFRLHFHPLRHHAALRPRKHPRHAIRCCRLARWARHTAGAKGMGTCIQGIQFLSFSILILPLRAPFWGRVGRLEQWSGPACWACLVLMHDLASTVTLLELMLTGGRTTNTARQRLERVPLAPPEANSLQTTTPLATCTRSEQCLSRYVAAGAQSSRAQRTAHPRGAAVHSSAQFQFVEHCVFRKVPPAKVAHGAFSSEGDATLSISAWSAWYPWEQLT